MAVSLANRPGISYIQFDGNRPQMLTDPLQSAVNKTDSTESRLAEYPTLQCKEPLVAKENAPGDWLISST